MIGDRGSLALALALLGALAGCIDDSLTSCGAAVCPAGTVCNDRYGCVYPEQLANCAHAADGMPCGIPNSPDGLCAGELCVPLVCGDGKRTPDEACDDGNNVNGDGCSADCRSAEVCGNGILDLAASEQCDDGNQDELDDCRTDCSLPFCGDAIVDRTEDCDAGPIAASCGDFGYYNGTVGCNTACRFDLSSCTDRCGDGVIQNDHGEECDGNVPSFTCVDTGYDFGAMTCSPVTCTLDARASCDRYGWRFVHDVAGVTRLAADTDTIAIAMNTAGLDVGDAGAWTHVAGTYVAVDVRGTHVLAATATTVRLRDQGTWQDLPAPPLGVGAQIAEVVLAIDDGTPMVLATDATVYQLDQGAWRATAQPAGASHLVGFAVDDFAVATSGALPTSVTWTFPGGPLTTDISHAIFEIERTPAGLTVYSFEAPQLYRTIVLPSGATTSPIANGFDGDATANPILARGDVYAARNAAEVLRASITNIPPDKIRIEVTPVPPRLASAPFAMFRGHDGTIYALGDAQESGTGLYELGALAAVTRQAPTGVGRVGLADDGSLAVCDAVYFYLPKGKSFEQFTMPHTISLQTACRSLWGVSHDLFYVVRAYGLGTDALSKGVFLWNGSGFLPQLYNGARINATFVTGDAATTFLLVNSAGPPVNIQILGNTTGSANQFTPVIGLPVGCQATALAVQNGALYAAAQCVPNNPAIFLLAGDNWTQLYDASAAGDPITSLYVAPDGVMFAIAGTLAVVITNGVAAPTPIASDLNGRSGVLGTSSSDVFAFHSKTGAGNVVLHWDGARWSPIRTDPNAVLDSMIVTSHDVALMPDGTGAWTGFIRGRSR